MQRGMVGVYQTLKTHCPQGHPYTSENTYIHPKRGVRECLTCRKATSQYRYVYKYAKVLLKHEEQK